jgi:hypothetical protein
MAATYTGQHKLNRRRQTSLSRVGFKPTIPLFERAKIFFALDRRGRVIGLLNSNNVKVVSEAC